jgi:hypothetical protein
MNVEIIPGIDGRTANVFVGSGEGNLVPDGFTDCDGRIGGI